jgi:hypothetical protein
VLALMHHAMHSLLLFGLSVRKPMNLASSALRSSEHASENKAASCDVPVMSCSC